MITNDNGFIYVYIYTVEIHCRHCKGIKTNKTLKNNVTALKGLKNVYTTAPESVSESEAKSLLL